MAAQKYEAVILDLTCDEAYAVKKALEAHVSLLQDALEALDEKVEGAL